MFFVSSNKKQLETISKNAKALVKKRRVQRRRIRNWKPHQRFYWRIRKASGKALVKKGGTRWQRNEGISEKKLKEDAVNEGVSEKKVEKDEFEEGESEIENLINDFIGG